MGLADLRARLFLFFAKKLREWANSIDENFLSPRTQPASVVVEKGGNEPVTETGPDDDALGSEPSQQPFTRFSSGPPQHWVDLVRERAPELLSLTQEYSQTEVSLPEDQDYPHRSDRDDEVKIPDQRSGNVPTVKEDVARNLGPVPLPPPKVVDKRSARKLTRVKSFKPRPKPLTLKPLTEPKPHLQPPDQAREQVTEPAKPSQLIEVFGSDKRNVSSREQSRLSAADRKDQVATGESARQPSRQAPRSDKTSANYETTNAATPMVPAAQPPGELNVTTKPEVQRPAFNVVRKPLSGPRRYLQAIVSVTRKTLRRTLRRTARDEVQFARTIMVVNPLVNPSSKHSSSTPDVVRFGEAPKTRPPVRHEAPSTPVIQRSERKTAPFTYQRSRAPETARRQASPPTRLRPKVAIENVKTASRLPSTVAFPRAVNRFAEASNAHIQDAFVNMPALMDEEKMNRASSVHLPNLRPGKNQWPDLPSAASTEMADELATHERDTDRMRRLKQEQRGTPWNE